MCFPELRGVGVDEFDIWHGHYACDTTEGKIGLTLLDEKDAPF